MAFAGLGTDTGGSCRIPAALCGIAGFKPTASRVPLAGCYPLSTTLDSAGPLANSVACCRVLDAVLSRDPALCDVASAAAEPAGWGQRANPPPQITGVRSAQMATDFI